MATDYKIVVVPIRGAFDYASHAPRIGTTTITDRHTYIHTYIHSYSSGVRPYTSKYEYSL